MPPQTILLATDLSPRCDRALDRAASLTAEWHARLVVLHALQEPLPVTDLPSWRRPPDPRLAAWHRVRADLQGTDRIDVDVVVERGEPAPVILAAIERLAPDLLVTGVARDETLGRVLLGTTVQKVVRKTNVPMLVVRSRPRGPYQNLIVATDFSEGSRCALEEALALLPAAHLTLFHAFDVTYEGFVEDKMAAREAARRLAMSESETFLAAIPAIAASGRRIATLYEYGEVSSLLEDLVQARGVDLVVVGTEGRGALASTLLGSVAQRLLSRLSVDVLMVRRRRN